MIPILPLIIGGGVALAGNVVRSWQTDENYHEAKAKNRKATRIVQEAAENLEEATRRSQREQLKLVEARRAAYGTLLEFVEIFRSIDDVRFKDSMIKDERIGQIPTETIHMLKNVEFTPTIVDNTQVGDAAGLLSMLLPVGVGSFGSFSSLQESKAAVLEAESNVYEAQCMVREVESAILVADAIADRFKLVSGTLSGIHKMWFKNATKEFKRLVESKNSIKYYFLQRDEESVYTDEEYAFIAALAALSKTVKSLIDVEVVDQKERDNEDLSDNATVVHVTKEIEKQSKKDSSFGLKQTYCGGLLSGEVKESEFIRPSDSFVDNFEWTRAKLVEEGYDAVCDFEDYILSHDTRDSKEVKGKYLEICDSLFTEELYRTLKENIEDDTKAFGFGYKTLTTFRDTLIDNKDMCPEKLALIECIDEKSESLLNKKGNPKLGHAGFGGMKKLVHHCLFEIDGRRVDKIQNLGEVLSKNAIKNGYNNVLLNKLPTITYYEECARKATPIQCIIMILLCVLGGYLLQNNDLITWCNVGALVSMGLGFVISNRKDDGFLKFLQVMSLLGLAVCGAAVFYTYANEYIAIKHFTVINGIILGVNLVFIFAIKEHYRFVNLFVSRIVKIVFATSLLMFGVWALDMYTNVSFGPIIATVCQGIASFVLLMGIKRDNIYAGESKNISLEKKDKELIKKAKKEAKAQIKAEIKKESNIKSSTTIRNTVGAIVGIVVGILAAVFVKEAWCRPGEKYLWFDAVIVNRIAIGLFVFSLITVIIGKLQNTKLVTLCRWCTVISLTVLFTFYCRNIQETKHYIVIAVVALVVSIIVWLVCLGADAGLLSVYIFLIGLYQLLFLVYALFTIALGFSQVVWLVILSVVIALVSMFGLWLFADI